MNRAAAKGDASSEATAFDMANWRTAKLFVIQGILLTASLSAALVSGESNWPSFRGPGTAGVLDGLDLPERWDAETAGIFWHAGENDTYFGPYLRNYAAGMKELITQTRLGKR